MWPSLAVICRVFRGLLYEVVLNSETMSSITGNIMVAVFFQLEELIIRARVGHCKISRSQPNCAGNMEPGEFPGRGCAVLHQELQKQNME